MAPAQTKSMIKDPENQSDEPFLSRWSRRKQEKDKETEVQNEQVEGSEESPASGSDAPAELIETVSDTVEVAGIEGDIPVLTDADMPPIESLDANSDYSGFMSPGVSGQLRKLALRKLFAGAVFNIRDGLDDYDEDFTSFEPLGDLVTSDMKHQAEMAEKRKREAEEKETAEQLTTDSESEETAEALTELEEDRIEPESEKEALDTESSTLAQNKENGTESAMEQIDDQKQKSENS